MIKSLKLNQFIFSVFLLIIVDFITYILIVNAQVVKQNIVNKNNSNSPTNKLKLPLPPQTGTPKGNQTPGATRPENLCPSTNQPVTALMANKGKDYTLSGYPSFWFYIPYQPSAIKYVEFALKNTENSSTIYRTAIQLQNTSGIIKITIPQEEKYALKNENNYTWQLILSCEGNETYEPDVMVNGWIKKLATNAELQSQIKQISPLEIYQFYLSNEVWYDAINQLAELYFNNPDNFTIKQEWLNLLTILEQKKLTKQLLGEVVLSPPKF